MTNRRKIVYICDMNNRVDFMTSAPVKALLDPVWARHNVDFQVVQDQEDLHMSLTELGEKFEREGTEWYHTPEKVLQAVQDAEVLIFNYVLANKQLIDAAPHCKLLLTSRGGVENINVAYATERGIQVANSPFSNNFSVPDFAIALILAATRQIFQVEIGVQGGHWMPQHSKGCRPMSKQTIGLMGFGTIAKSVAAKLKGFGCTVLAYDPFVPDTAVRAAGATPVSLEALLEESDVVSLHVRLLPSTKGSFRREYFQRMKPTAWLVNTARAGLVDTPALLDALQTGKIAGAALDVYDEEPLPSDSPLYAMPNVILEPHISGSTCDTRLARIQCFLADLEHYLDTGDIAAKINFRPSK